jgi:short-subunit dehydrogenase
MANPTAGGGRRTALITGASGGIGLELARCFAAGGYDLVLVARTADKLEELAVELRRHFQGGGGVRVMVKDLARPEAPEEIHAELADGGVEVDALVNNAGFATFGPFVEIPLDRELEELQLNIITLTHLTKKLLPGMLARRRGGVLNLASTAAFQPGPLMAVYYASKAYVLSLSEALAEELHGTGVTVTALCPGPTQTGFQARAQMETSKLFSGALQVADAGAVARAGYAGFQAGKRIVIPGLLNRLGVQSIRVSPRALAPRVVKKMQERRR